MNNQEKVIVTLTSYKARLFNIPHILDTIYYQTLLPDLVVLNLAYEEQVPSDITDYIDKHNIEVFRVPDTKVYKKLIPTLKRYPNDIVISIDDDWLYPNGMIADFLEMHKKYPNNPISGNDLVYSEMICHCGCASLTKAEYFGSYLNDIETVIPNCPCDDIVYTYFANKAGHPYITSKEMYFTNMTPYNEGVGYSELVAGEHGLENSWSYLINNYGELPNFPNEYIEDPYISDLLYHIHTSVLKQAHKEAQTEIRATNAYKIGKILLKPLSFIRHNLFKS